jgi:serine/threonine-protein kinase HipA
MMISNLNNAKEAYVWIWLPGAREPIVAAKIAKKNNLYAFTYGRSYRENLSAIGLSPFELPLEVGEFLPAGLNNIHSCVRDAAPDAWGRRLIDYQYPKLNPTELDYLLLSGSNRIGGLDFQVSGQDYQPRDSSAISLEDINSFAKTYESEKSFDPNLAAVLLHGTSVGGARPKCLITIDNNDYVAKFSTSSDYYPIIKAEYVAMKLASLVGLNVAQVELNSMLGRDILLVKRFDRVYEGTSIYRKLMLSGLSLLGLNEMEARYASYPDLADIIRQKFCQPKETLRELFGRLVFNVLIGNTDDHARNHAAFWDGRSLNLTPAYDICPQQRVGQEASQAMLINGEMNNLSTLQNVISISNKFLLSCDEANSIVQTQIKIIETHWDELCDQAKLAERDKETLWRNVVLSDFCFIGERPSLNSKPQA